MKQTAAEGITVEWDPETHVVYLRVNTAEIRRVKRTERVAPGLLIDLDSKGRLVGVEMLRPGVLELVLRKVAPRYRSPGLRKLADSHVRNRLEHLLATN